MFQEVKDNREVEKVTPSDNWEISHDLSLVILQINRMSLWGANGDKNSMKDNYGFITS